MYVDFSKRAIRPDHGRPLWVAGFLGLTKKPCFNMGQKKNITQV